MSISPTGTPVATTSQTPDAGPFPATKHTFSTFSGRQEESPESLEAKIIRKLPPVPAFTPIVELSDEVKTITTKLLPLFRKPDAAIESRLLATVDYIEKHRETLIEIARFELRKTLYIHPDKSLAPCPFHIQICVNDEGVATIYILPKVHFLGRGTTKRVNKAINYSMGINVACATIRLRDEAILRKTLHEFAMQKLFGQANNLSIYFRHKMAAKAHIFMPYGDFGSLERCVRPKGHQELFEEFNAEERQKIFQQLLHLIAKFHSAGMVIADLKPENIIIQRTDGNIKVLLPDLGTSYKEQDPNAERYVGSPRYMGPEYLENLDEESQFANIGRPTDLFALGITLWELFIGGTPSWMIDLPSTAMWINPEAYRKAYAEAPGYQEQSLEWFIYIMTHPDPHKRPTVHSLIDQSPTLEIKSPAYSGIRLLTPTESASRHDHNQQAVDKMQRNALPPESCYTLMQGSRPNDFFIHTREGLVKVKPREEGKVRVYVEEKRYRTYSSLDAFLERNNLIYCLNFNT